MAFFQATHLWVQEAGANVAAIVLDGPEKFNYLDDAVLAELEQALTAIEAEPRFEWCLMKSKKAASFCHGVKAATWAELATAEQIKEFTHRAQRVCGRLTSSRMPTVAVIGGACLGGGLELALACDWRIAIRTPQTELGFCELEVGLVPAWGGVNRMLELAGLERSLHMLLGDKRLSADAAQQWGLVDEVADVDAHEQPRCPPHKRTCGNPPHLTWRRRLLESTSFGRRLILRGVERMLRGRVPEDMPAPWAVLDAARSADADSRLRESLGPLRASAACGNLLRLRALDEQRRAADAECLRPKRIGILGATPLALHLAAQAVVRGCTVVLREKDEMALGMASLQLVKTLQEGVTRGESAPEYFESNVNRVRPTVSWKDFGDLELVIDATHGDAETHRQLMHELGQHVSDQAVVACLRPWRPLSDWQPRWKHPERTLGLHLPPPVGRAPIVEILQGTATDAEAVRLVRGFATLLRKTTVVAKEESGGLIQRVLGAGMGEALHLLEEGYLLERLAEAMHRFGMLYGPLEQLDLMGVDEFVLTATRLAPILGENLGEQPIIQHMFRQRWLGVKTGVGFYRHAKGAISANRALARWLRRNHAVNIRPMSTREQQETIRQRLVDRMVGEARRCQKEGVVASADDIDLAMMMIGWAPHRGGPCRYAEQAGNDNP